MSVRDAAGDGSRSTHQQRKADAMKAGQLILIPKQLRAEWMDLIALDPTVSHVAFRPAGVIGSHFNKYSGDTFLNQEKLARVMGVSERTVWTAVNELERLGYLIVKRREFGTLTRNRKDGTELTIRVAGGRGVANTYLPAF
jgi:biotin operon repressor